MKKIGLNYGMREIVVDVPDSAIIYKSSYTQVSESPAELLLSSLANPVGSQLLESKLLTRKAGNVVIVVSDFTRPIPYYEFLPQLLNFIIQKGVRNNEIIILVATGMHRPSSQDEKIKMFGENIVNTFKIVDHDAEDEAYLSKIQGLSWSGEPIRLNKYYVDAGFRILTGLVEPHFMAGFSGGRKAICPGLASLDAIKKFHGYEFLSHPNASNAVLENNPCNNENTSVARLCPSDFLINIVLDQKKKICRIISGDQFHSHESAVNYVKERSCVDVIEKVDIAITSCGGYPLDNTFYQCVKGFVNCLPALKPQGSLIAFGSCAEGIGSPEYISLMKQYAKSYHKFIEDIKSQAFFIKDQWQFQMHIRVLNTIGVNNLHFYTSEIDSNELALLSVTPHALEFSGIGEAIQQQINNAITQGKTIALFPEGPYCSPI